MNIKNLALSLLLAPIFSLAHAQTTTTNIADLFPFAAQSHSTSGEVNLEWGSNVSGTNNRVLDFKKSEHMYGICDGVSQGCSISNKVAPTFDLKWDDNFAFKDTWQPNIMPLPEFFEYLAGGDTLVCDWNKNKDIIVNGDVYKSITVLSSCSISANKEKVIIKEKVSVSGTLFLAPGHYWMDSLELQGSGTIKSLSEGSLHIYVKNKLDLSSSQALGSIKSPVNIIYYGHDDAELKGALIGSFNTHANLKMSGSSSLNKLIQAKSLDVQGSAKITMLPGTYWLEKFDISGGAEILQPQIGDIKLHVKNNVSIKISKLGASDRKVNISNYNGNVDFGDSLTFYGDLNTRDEFELQGSSKIYGAVIAKSLDLQGSAKLYLSSGGYWYENIKLQGSGALVLNDNELTTLHVENKVEASGGGAFINQNDKPLLLFIYGTNKSSLDLQGSARLNGHVYTQGGVEISGGETKIIGAVNVVDLTMKGGTIQYKRLEYTISKPDHYKLNFNDSLELVTASACANADCSNYYNAPIAKLKIIDAINNSNVVDFLPFNSTSSEVNIKNKLKKCMSFTIEDEINKSGASPWPTASQPLRCSVAGQDTSCHICGEAVELSAYVYGKLDLTASILAAVPASAQLVFESINGRGILKDFDKGSTFNKGDKIALPLSLTYDQAESFELKLKDVANGQQNVIYKLNLIFVPKTLAWLNASTKCVNEDNKFIYRDSQTKCQVLGKAGEQVTLTLQALGEGKRLIENYQAQQNDLITISELNDQVQLQVGTTAVVSSLNFTNELTVKHEVKTVSLIQANVKEHCAAYALKKENGGCSLSTLGDTAILGRTVPASLFVKDIKNGKIVDDVVYAAQPDDVAFSTIPSFTIQGLDTNKKPLPSYTGEFAGGLLNNNSKLRFGAELAKLSGSTLGLSYSEPGTEGEHLLELDAATLKFLKDKPFSETSLALPLALTINDHDQTKGITDKANLGDENDQLRYGFLSIDKLDLPVNTAGDMPVHFNYYGSNTDSIEQDIKTNTGIETSHSIFSLTPDSGVATAKPTGLEFKEQTIEGKLVKVIKVPAHSSEWRGKVDMEVDKWLKPYENGLVNPSAELIIKNTARGNDRIFNRREVVR